jgi:GTP-binding protein
MRLSPKFLLSATDVAHFPTEAKTFGAPEIAFLGRSNVGKSSLINSLLGSREAKVSSTPGRTRAINFFALHEGAGEKMKIRPTLIFADLPGYGYAKISKSISSEWPKFIEPYLTERETLALGICLVDTNIPPQPSDKQLIEFFQQTGRPYLVVGTKADRLSNNELAKSIAALKREHGVDEVLPVSAKTDAGTKVLWQRLMAVAEQSLPTPRIKS